MAKPEGLVIHARQRTKRRRRRREHELIVSDVHLRKSFITPFWCSI
jgi:hypothetical protein